MDDLTDSRPLLDRQTGLGPQRGDAGVTKFRVEGIPYEIFGSAPIGAPDT